MKQKNKLLIIVCALIICTNIKTVYGQATGNNNWFVNRYLGWSTAHDLPFKINGPTYMTLQSGTGNIGINTTAPNFKLEVNNDINLTNSVQNQGYRIGGIVVLQKPGLRNTFVGENSGISTTTAYAGTFIGRDAGRLNTTGRANTFVGSEAGPINSIGEFNTFIGDECGMSNSTGV